MAMELKTKNQWLALQAYCFPLSGTPNVEVVLRHFHQSRYRSSLLWFFCGKAFSLLIISSR
jgi:hypothetical protein